MLEVVEGFVFCLDFFRAAIASGSGHRDDLASFLRAVAEACSPQRFREENAVVRFISLSEPGDMYHDTTIYVYDFASPSSKLPSRSLRVGNSKELLHTTQLQTALYTAAESQLVTLMVLDWS
jgi:hypothetical protein